MNILTDPKEIERRKRQNQIELLATAIIGIVSGVIALIIIMAFVFNLK